MRYLTHESEDNFWIKHGAKLHPLAKAEAEHRAQTAAQQQALTEPNGRVKFNNNVLISNGSSNTAHGLTVEQVAASMQSRGSKSGGSSESLASDNRDRTSSTSSKHCHDMSDEEIVKSLAHAERVGYKVSTV